MFDLLLNALRGTGIEFAENAWVDASKIGSNADYGCVSVDGSGRTVWADDGLTHQAIEGTVDLFTHGPGRDGMEVVQAAMDSIGISYRLADVMFESDTRLAHWQWVFQLEWM